MSKGYVEIGSTDELLDAFVAPADHRAVREGTARLVAEDRRREFSDTLLKLLEVSSPKGDDHEVIEWLLDRLAALREEAEALHHTLPTATPLRPSAPVLPSDPPAADLPVLRAEQAALVEESLSEARDAAEHQAPVSMSLLMRMLTAIGVDDIELTGKVQGRRVRIV
ncbi:BHLH transcriptional factor [Streptomyces laurentii]|uniref:BHLH transcriptional factor n=1 Tax=Streptomyces laurentii TaxID=39478 RepID=A0A169NAK3_STRLU|nr:BHLH transcriptional factor [Streptomyces laurentii]